MYNIYIYMSRLFVKELDVTVQVGAYYIISTIYTYVVFFWREFWGLFFDNSFEPFSPTQIILLKLQDTILLFKNYMFNVIILF